MDKREILINPYDGINWNTTNKFKVDFHQHSSESDGSQHPAILIDQAKNLGVDMFVISDHDSYRINRGKYPKVLNVSDPSAKYYDATRPDGDFRNIFPFHYFDEDVYYDPNSNKNYTELARVGVKGEFDIVDDKVKGMLTFPACEFTENHHIISILSDADGFPAGRTEDEDIQSSEERGGVTYFAHMGDHSDPELGRWYEEKYTPQWYVDTLRKYPSCLGLEIVNQNDRYYNDRKLWDHVNNIGYIPRAAWGFSGSDSHTDFIVKNLNVMFMEELTLAELKYRMQKGNFYCVYGNSPPVINKVVTDKTRGTITVSVENERDTVEWISDGIVVHVGNELKYNEVLGISKFVRAVVRGKLGTSYLNPIYFNRFVKPRFI